MKFVLQSLVGLTFLALPWLGYSAPPPAAAPKPNVDAQVRAALAIAQASHRRPTKKSCGCGDVCPCTPGKRGDYCSCQNRCFCSEFTTPTTVPNCGCDGPDCRCAPGKCDCTPNSKCSIDCDCKRKKDLSLNAAIDRAIRENKPIVVWVKLSCPPCQAALPDCVHVRVDEDEGGEWATQSPGAVIAKLVRGELIVVGTVYGCPTDFAQRVRAILNPPRITYYVAPPMPVYYSGVCRS